MMVWAYRRLRMAPFWAWFVIAGVILSPIIYDLILNAQGPSTYYFQQQVASAIVGADGLYYIHVGDKFEVHANVIRHRSNGGDCRLRVWRVRQDVGGAFDGWISLIQPPYVDQHFQGDDKFRQTSWPLPGAIQYPIIVGNDWFIDPAAREQTIDVFVIARYDCNLLDKFVARWLQNSGEELEEIGHRKLNGFEIPHWQPGDGESEHTRVVLVR